MTLPEKSRKVVEALVRYRVREAENRTRDRYRIRLLILAALALLAAVGKKALSWLDLG